MSTTLVPFTQADGNLSGWSPAAANAAQVVSNALGAPATATDYASYLTTGVSMATYGYTQITVTQTNTAFLMYARFDIAANNGYALNLSPSNTLRIVRITGGVETELIATGAGAVSSGVTHVLKLEFVGSTINAYVDGVLTLTTTDATYTAGTTVVLYCRRTTGTFVGDDFIYSNDPPILARQMFRNQAVRRASTR